MGALRAGWDRLAVIVHEFTSLTQVMLDFAVRTLSRHTLTPLEVGRTILRLRLAYELEQARGATSDLPPFPTQEELGRMLGRSHSTVNQWLKLASQPPAFVNLVDSGAISQSQAIELLRIPAEAERVVEAERLVERNTLRRISATAVRGQVVARKQPIALEDEAPLPYDDLWSARLTRETPVPLAMASLSHDLDLLLAQHLEHMRAECDQPHPALSKLYRALGDPAIQTLITQLQTSD